MFSSLQWNTHCVIRSCIGGCTRPLGNQLEALYTTKLSWLLRPNEKQAQLCNTPAVNNYMQRPYKLVLPSIYVYTLYIKYKNCTEDRLAYRFSIQWLFRDYLNVKLIGFPKLAAAGLSFTSGYTRGYTDISSLWDSYRPAGAQMTIMPCQACTSPGRLCLVPSTQLPFQKKQWRGA